MFVRQQAFDGSTLEIHKYRSTGCWVFVLRFANGVSYRSRKCKFSNDELHAIQDGTMQPRDMFDESYVSRSKQL